jgi:hypothetical protein
METEVLAELLIQYHSFKSFELVQTSVSLPEESVVVPLTKGLFPPSVSLHGIGQLAEDQTQSGPEQLPSLGPESVPYLH